MKYVRHQHQHQHQQ